MNPKQPSNAWLRNWHRAIVEECGTDDIGVLTDAVRAHKREYMLKAMVKALWKKGEREASLPKVVGAVLREYGR